MKLPDSLRALNYYNFRLYVVGQSVSLVGTWMQRIAVGWLVYEMTHSAFMLGLVAFSSQIPMLILSPYSGTYVDRHSRYRTLLVTQIASMVQAGLLALAVLTNHYSVELIIALSVMLGIINAFDAPSRQSLMIVLVKQNYDLQNAIAINSSMVTLARLAGPAVAGILLSTVGEGICFLINFLSFFAVIGCLLAMKLKIPPRIKNVQPIWANLAEGYNYLRRTPSLRNVIWLIGLVSLLITPYITLFPVFAEEVFHGDVTTFSWLNSIAGLGALLGAIYLATLKDTRKLLKVITIAGLILTANLILFSFTKSLIIALVFIMLAESGLLTTISATNTYLQTHVEERMRGRVISYYVMAFAGMQPIGNFLMGALAHAIGAPLTVTIQGVLGMIAYVAFVPAFKRVHHRDMKIEKRQVRILRGERK